MNTLHFSIHIQASKEKVWSILLSQSTYREWTKAFSGSSIYEGDWSEGSRMRFLGIDESGNVEGGMISIIAKNIPYEFMSIKHIGMLENGVENIWEESDTFENYTLTTAESGTELRIDLVNLPLDYNEMMNESWPKALEALRELAEKIKKP